MLPPADAPEPLALASPLPLAPAPIVPLPVEALPDKEPLPEPLADEPEADPDPDPEAAVFSFGWPVAASRQCVSAEMLPLAPAPAEELPDD